LVAFYDGRRIIVHSLNPRQVRDQQEINCCSQQLHSSGERLFANVNDFERLTNYREFVIELRFSA
jgi:hypothetical protein